MKSMLAILVHICCLVAASSFTAAAFHPSQSYPSNLTVLAVALSNASASTHQVAGSKSSSVIETVLKKLREDDFLVGEVPTVECVVRVATRATRGLLAAPTLQSEDIRLQI